MGLSNAKPSPPCDAARCNDVDVESSTLISDSNFTVSRLEPCTWFSGFSSVRFPRLGPTQEKSWPGHVSCVETYLLSEVVKAGLARVPFLADSSDASPIHEVPRLEAHRFSSASSYRPGREDEKANGTARKFRRG